MVNTNQTNSKNKLHAWVFSLLVLATPLVLLTLRNKSNPLDLANVFYYVIFSLIAIPISFLLTSKNKIIQLLTYASLVVSFFLTRFPQQIPVINIFSYSIQNEVLVILIVLFISFFIAWVLAKHIIQISIVFFLSLLVTSLFFDSSEQTRNHSTFNKGLPPYIHIILDAHSSINQLYAESPEKTEVVKNFTKSYLNAGFQIYDNAYSKYEVTKYSVASMFNFAQHSGFENILNYGAGYQLLQNKYFDELVNRGYKIKVFQMDGLDYCSNNSDIIHCITKASDGIGSDIKISFKSKINYYFYAIISRYRINVIFKKLSLFNNNFKAIPIYPTLSVISQFSAVDSFLDNPENGIAYIVHLVAPHAPFILNENCQLLSEKNTELQSRSVAQTACVHKKVSPLVNKIISQKPMSSILIHSDHGRRESAIPNAISSIPLVRDFKISYSSLFMYRDGSNPQGTHNRTFSALPTILAHIVHGIQLNETENVSIFVDEEGYAQGINDKLIEKNIPIDEL